MIEVGQHLWYSKWDSFKFHYCVVLEVDGGLIKVRLVNEVELWVNEFELSEDLNE